MVTQKTGPEPGALQRQVRKQDRNDRNRKVGAVAVAAVVALVVTLVVVSRPDEATKPADVEPSPGQGVARLDGLGAQIVRLDGSTQAPLTGLPDDAQAIDVSNDGTTLAFTTLVGTTWQVATSSMEAAGTDTTILTHGPQESRVPSISPDGSQIAFQRASTGGNDDIFVMNADGSELRRLVGGPLDESTPDWSPDGTMIVFARGRFSPSDADAGTPDTELWTVTVGSGVEQQLTDDGFNDIEPAWAPDGQRIAYFHVGDLYTIRTDGSGAKPITQAEGGAWSPSWSPDGTRIAFLEGDPSDRGLLPTGGGESRDAPLLGVRIVDVASGRTTSIDARVVTDWNGVSWLPSGRALLVNRWD